MSRPDLHLDGSGPTRRSLARAAAWAVPAAAVVSAAPAMASSPAECVDLATRHSATLKTTIHTYTNQGWYSGSGEWVRAYGQYATLSVTTTLTYQGPDPLPVGAALQLFVGISASGASVGTILSRKGSAAEKFGEPAHYLIGNTYWGRQMITTEELLPGDTIEISWRVSPWSLVPAGYNGGGTHVDTRFLFPLDECGKTTKPYLLACNDTTATPSSRHRNHTYSFVFQQGR